MTGFSLFAFVVPNRVFAKVPAVNLDSLAVSMLFDIGVVSVWVAELLVCIVRSFR